MEVDGHAKADPEGAAFSVVVMVTVTVFGAGTPATRPGSDRRARSSAAPSRLVAAVTRGGGAEAEEEVWGEEMLELGEEAVEEA